MIPDHSFIFNLPATGVSNGDGAAMEIPSDLVLSMGMASLSRPSHELLAYLRD